MTVVHSVGDNGLTTPRIFILVPFYPYVFASEYRRSQIAALLGQFGDERLTLVTCYPWFTNTHRLIVVAHPVDSSDG